MLRDQWYAGMVCLKGNKKCTRPGSKQKSMENVTIQKLIIRRGITCLYFANVSKDYDQN